MRKNNNIPNKVQIGPYNFKIITMENLSSEDKKVDGYIDFENCEIYIEQNICDDVKKTTLLHEILHAILMQSDIDSSGDNVIHKAVNIISMGLLDVLRRNQDILKYLI